MGTVINLNSYRRKQNAPKPTESRKHAESRRPGKVRRTQAESLAKINELLQELRDVREKEEQ